MGVCAVCVLGVQGVLGSCVCGRGCGIVCCMRMSMRRRKEFADGIVCIVAAACAIIIKFVYIFWYFRVQHSNCSCSCKEDTRCGAEEQGRGGTIYQPAVWQVHLPKS